MALHLPFQSHSPPFSASVPGVQAFITWRLFHPDSLVLWLPGGSSQWKALAGDGTVGGEVRERLWPSPSCVWL